MSIPFIDLKAQYRRIETQVQQRIQTVLEHGAYIMGAEISELETRLAEFAGVKHALSCSSGTDALLLPLMAWGIGPGDAVFTTPFTFFATAEVISLVGARPVFVDIDPKTFNICPKALKAEIQKVKAAGEFQPRVVIPVDLFGLPADYDAINEVAAEFGLQVLEDTAQGLGGVYKGRPAGSLAEVAATSFFPAKPLGAYGDGGAVFTNDDRLADIMRSLRVHGQGQDKYNNVRIGLNARMDTLQAAILLCKLDIFADELDARQQVAAWYGEELKDLTLPYIPQGYRSAWAQYSVLCDNRDRRLAQLAAAGIPSAIYYSKPLHLQEAFADLGYKTGDFPASELASQRIFSLPMHPYLDRATVKKIAEALRTEG